MFDKRNFILPRYSFTYNSLLVIESIRGNIAAAALCYKLIVLGKRRREREIRLKVGYKKKGECGIFI